MGSGHSIFSGLARPPRGCWGSNRNGGKELAWSALGSGQSSWAVRTAVGASLRFTGKHTPLGMVLMKKTGPCGMTDLVQPIQKTPAFSTVSVLDKSQRWTALLGHRDEPFERILNEQVHESSAGGCASSVRFTCGGTAVLPEGFEERRERHR
jgi:hypothetical protein